MSSQKDLERRCPEWILKYGEHRRKPTEESEQMLRERKGYRCESFSGTGIRRARDVIGFEVIELHNDHVTYDACEALGIDYDRCTLGKVLDTIEQRFGSDAVAIWLATKEVASSDYCESDEEPDEIPIPDDALIVSDMHDGALFVWAKKR
mgnify:CR=1 FL=1